MNQQEVLGTNPVTIPRQNNGGNPRLLEVDARKVRGLSWGYRKESGGVRWSATERNLIHVAGNVVRVERCQQATRAATK